MIQDTSTGDFALSKNGRILAFKESCYTFGITTGQGEN